MAVVAKRIACFLILFTQSFRVVAMQGIKQVSSFPEAFYIIEKVGMKKETQTHSSLLQKVVVAFLVASWNGNTIRDPVKQRWWKACCQMTKAILSFLEEKENTQQMGKIA